MKQFDELTSAIEKRLHIGVTSFTAKDVYDLLTTLRAAGQTLAAVKDKAGNLLRAIDGILAIGEPEIRAAVGNTNLACLRFAEDELHAVLDERKDTTRTQLGAGART